MPTLQTHILNHPSAQRSLFASKKVFAVIIKNVLKTCFLKLKPHLARQKIKELPGTFNTGKFFLPFVDFCIKTDAARKAASSQVWGFMKVDKAGCVEALQMSPCRGEQPACPRRWSPIAAAHEMWKALF